MWRIDKQCEYFSAFHLFVLSMCPFFWICIQVRAGPDKWDHVLMALFLFFSLLLADEMTQQFILEQIQKTFPKPKPASRCTHILFREGRMLHESTKRHKRSVWTKWSRSLWSSSTSCQLSSDMWPPPKSAWKLVTNVCLLTHDLLLQVRWRRESQVIRSLLICYRPRFAWWPASPAELPSVPTCASHRGSWAGNGGREFHVVSRDTETELNAHLPHFPLSCTAPTSRPPGPEGRLGGLRLLVLQRRWWICCSWPAVKTPPSWESWVFVVPQRNTTCWRSVQHHVATHVHAHTCRHAAQTGLWGRVWMGSQRFSSDAATFTLLVVPGRSRKSVGLHVQASLLTDDIMQLGRFQSCMEGIFLVTAWSGQPIIKHYEVKPCFHVKSVRTFCIVHMYSGLVSISRCPCSWRSLMEDRRMNR